LRLLVGQQAGGIAGEAAEHPKNSGRRDADDDDENQQLDQRQAALGLRGALGMPRRNSHPCHCERSAATQCFDQTGISGLPRRCAPRNDDLFMASLIAHSRFQAELRL